jgi:hypothetical protein
MSMTDDLERAIVAEVEAAQGCKLTELIAREGLFLYVRSGQNIVQAVERLIERGELIEVEYDLAAGPLSGRLKSFLLPKGTHIYLDGVLVRT